MSLRTPMMVLVLAIAVTACGKDEKKKKEVDDRFSDFIFVVDEVKGDMSGWTGGDSFETAEWLIQPDVPKSKRVDLPALIEITDFQGGELVENARVRVWESDRANDGNADVDETSDVNGVVGMDALPTCDPFAFLVTTDAALGDTKPTYKAHQVMAFDDDGTLNDEFQSVSSVTYQLIPALLGIQPDPKKSIIAGAVYDRDPSGDEVVENAQVIVYVDNEIPDSLIVKYFVEDFPNRDQEATSADGLWVAIDVPVGEVRAEAWGVIDGELTLLGASELVSEKDSINIGSIYTGYSDGIFFPEACY